MLSCGGHNNKGSFIIKRVFQHKVLCFKGRFGLIDWVFDILTQNEMHILTVISLLLGYGQVSRPSFLYRTVLSPCGQTGSTIRSLHKKWFSSQLFYSKVIHSYNERKVQLCVQGTDTGQWIFFCDTAKFKENIMKLATLRSQV